MVCILHWLNTKDRLVIEKKKKERKQETQIKVRPLNGLLRSKPLEIIRLLQAIIYGLKRIKKKKETSIWESERVCPSHIRWLSSPIRCSYPKEVL